jgi:hypothetical protein
MARAKKNELMKDRCEHCGSTKRLNMHHPDYSKPLEVVTLCVPCHEKVHHAFTEPSYEELRDALNVLLDATINTAGSDAWQKAKALIDRVKQ